MKKFSLFIFTIFVLTACNSSEEAQTKSEVNSTQEAIEPAIANTVAELNISGMTCEFGCKGAIEKALSKTNGIQEASIDFEKTLAEVKFDNQKISSEKIVEVITSVNNGAYGAELLKETPIENSEATL